MAASGRKWPLLASGREWPQVAAFGKWPRVAASGRLFQFQIPHLMQPSDFFRILYMPDTCFVLERFFLLEAQSRAPSAIDPFMLAGFESSLVLCMGA